MAEPTVEVNGNQVETSHVYNAIRNSSNQDYQNHVPVANEQNLQETAQAIANYKPALNSFYSALLRIGMVNINSPRWIDPLQKEFTQRVLESGWSIEHLMVGWVDEHMFTYADADKVFAIEKPNVSALFSHVNRRSKYKVTVSIVEIQSILINQGVDSLLNRIKGAIDASVQRDNTKYIKAMFSAAIDDMSVIFKEVPKSADTSGDGLDYHKLIAEMREDYLNMGYVGNGENGVYYNTLGFDNPTKPEDILTIVSSHARAQMDVGVLASSFNMDKADLVGRRIPINSFDDGNVVALMLDKNFIQYYPYAPVQMYEAEIFNPETLTRTFWVHVWGSYTYVKWFNAIAYVKSLPDDFAGYSQFFASSNGNSKPAVIPVRDESLDIEPLYLEPLKAKVAANAGAVLKCDLSVNIAESVQQANSPKVSLVQDVAGEEVYRIQDITAGNSGTVNIDATAFDNLRLKITANTSAQAADAQYRGNIKLTTSLVTSDGKTVLLKPAETNVGLSRGGDGVS